MKHIYTVLSDIAFNSDTPWSLSDLDSFYRFYQGNRSEFSDWIRSVSFDEFVEVWRQIEKDVASALID